MDQYYTNGLIAARYAKEVFSRYRGDYQYVEPSAGTGSFLSLCPEGTLAYDLEPKYPGIVERDFLTVQLPMGKPIIVIGNPPFGKNASLAIQFFNHAALTAQVIAFIVPRTFRKTSVQNRLSMDFHLIYDEILPRYSFIFEGEPYDVPCTFQIWEKGEKRHPVIVQTTHRDFVFTTPEDSDFAIQRVGANAGTIKHSRNLSQQSHYFIRGDVLDIFEQIDFDAVKHDTAGNPSIAKSEIVKLYGDIKNKP